MNYSTILFFVLIFIGIFYFYVRKKAPNNQIKRYFSLTIVLLFILCLFVFLGSIFANKLNISHIYFDYFSYIGSCFIPITLLYTAITFSKTKTNFNKWYYKLLLVIPFISLIVLWTNDFHHLFYIKYSINLNETIIGPFANVYIIYTYSLLAISILILLKYMIKNAGFFSKQCAFLVTGCLIPIVINFLGTFGIIPITIYVTPISYSLSIVFFAFAIFKFKFLSVTPIAMQRIVDRMSDSFLVINDDKIISDFNDTFLKTFKLSESDMRNANFIEFIEENSLEGLDKSYINSILDKAKKTEETIQVKKEIPIKDKYFNIEASGIFSKNSFLGTLILLKDVTQHVLDTNTIKDNQSMLMEKERLASLGQMIGGIAHNLKTPIMSIAGAAEGLLDLTKEYDISIGDPQVTNEDHHAIVKDMNEWIEKIKTHTSYMSDVITAVKGQAVAFSDTNSDTFTISELLTHIDVLMRHELKNALVYLNTSILVPETLSIKGNINSLVQVINNTISNAIQAYGGKPNKNIDLIINKKNNDLIISIQDYGCGIPKKIQDKLFKEMITTKGKNGTGLGLFMSYSNIRAHFNGNMTFKSEEGKGTKFDITIPLS